MSDELRFRPRLLYLSTRPESVRAQLAGERASLEQPRPLRDDISTDEIAPLRILVHFDATLGRYPYLGFTAGGETPIGADAVRSAGFEVVVAGKRYGKGSSREHNVVAEMAAGVRLVIAESFERIHRQNADNVGLFTSTDFSLIARASPVAAATPSPNNPVFPDKGRRVVHAAALTFRTRGPAKLIRGACFERLAVCCWSV